MTALHRCSYGGCTNVPAKVMPQRVSIGGPTVWRAVCAHHEVLWWCGGDYPNGEGMPAPMSMADWLAREAWKAVRAELDNPS